MLSTSDRCKKSHYFHNAYLGSGDHTGIGGDPFTGETVDGQGCRFRLTDLRETGRGRDGRPSESRERKNWGRGRVITTVVVYTLIGRDKIFGGLWYFDLSKSVGRSESRSS